MSQKGEENDISSKSNHVNSKPPNSSIETQSTHHIPSASVQNPGSIPPQFMPPGGLGPNPYFWGPDWWNYYTAPSPFDSGYRDELNKNQVFNQAFPPHSMMSAGQHTKSQVGSTNPQEKGNQVPSSASSQQTAQHQQQQFMPPQAFMPPYMDPASYMYYSMAASNPFGYPMPFNPYGMGPYGGPMTPYGPQPTRSMMDDQHSMHSYQYDMDTKSERKMSTQQHAAPQRPQSVVGAMFKNEMSARNNGLLMENMNSTAHHNNLAVPASTIGKANDSSSAILNALDPNMSVLTSTKKESEIQHRLTPPLHQLPHVRACFSINGLVQIRANDPCEGQPALVDIINLSDLMEQHLSNLKSTYATDQLTSKKEEDEKEKADGEDEIEFNLQEEINKETLINYKLLQEFPGPLVKEYTSKAQLIQFCQKVVKDCLASNTLETINLIDPQSHALLWDYLALLVRQNGIIDLKTDISPLLLSGIVDSQNQWSLTMTSTSTITTTTSITATLTAKSSSSSSSSNQQQDFVIVGNNDSSNDASAVAKQKTAVLDVEETNLNKLRQLLGAGQRSDAIELAMKHNMWPHALFLASSSNQSANLSASSMMSLSSSVANIALNSNTNSSSNSNIESKQLQKVKARFINSLYPNDPIQTCYQLLLGRVPTVSSNVSKSEWNEWRRHLAIIVANVDDSNKDLVYTSIKTMGDSLAANGRVAASHFCYLLSDCSFGSFKKKSSKVVLIGSSHNQDFSKFCQINAIQATEIYEFARSLSSTKQTNRSSELTNNDFLDHFVKYKLIYTMRLLEFGLVNEACKYVEVLAKSVNMNPSLHSNKIASIYQLANRLRVFDSDFSIEDLNNSSNEPLWFQDLTNNYKKLYLNNFWHLLPSKESSIPEKSISNQAIDPNNANANNNATYNQQQHSSLPYQTNSAGNTNEMANFNLQTFKNEPKTSEPSPNSQVTSNQYYQPHQQIEQQQQAQIQQPIDSANQPPHHLQNQESLPFYPTNPNSNEHGQSEYAVGLNQQTQPQYQHQQHQSEYYNQQPQAEAEHSDQVPQFYNPANLAQISQPMYNPHQQEHNASRKSSIVSASSTNSAIPTPSYSLNQQQHAFNFNQSNQHAPQNATPPPAPPLYNPSNLTQPHSSYNNQYHNNVAEQASNQNHLRQNIDSRSRQSSLSFNDNALPNHHSSMLNYDQSSGLTKSQTFPANQEQQEYVESSKSEQNLNKDSRDSDQENEDNKPKKNDSAQPANESILWKTISKFIPSTATGTRPKKMVLPDDRKKTIIWDDKLKKYVDLKGGNSESNTIKPPPTGFPVLSNAQTSQVPNSQQPQAQSEQKPEVAPSNDIQAPPSSTKNVYSLKSAGKRNYYSKVDIMADKTKKLNDSQAIAPLLSTVAPPSQIPPKFFVPQPQPHQAQQQETTEQSGGPTNQYYQPQGQPNEQPMMHANQQQQSNQYYQPQQHNDVYGTDESGDTATTNSAESYGALGVGSSQDTSSVDSSNNHNQQNYNPYGSQHHQQSYDYQHYNQQHNQYQTYNQDGNQQQQQYQSNI